MRKEQIQWKLHELCWRWQKSIGPTMPATKYMFAGGCISSMLIDEEPKDYDLFILDCPTALAVANYYIGKFGEADWKAMSLPDSVKIVGPGAGVDVDDNGTDPWEPVFISKNGITLRNRVQIVLKIVDTRIRILHRFDFEHCKCSYAFGESLVVPNKSAQSILYRDVVFTGSTHPVQSMQRAIRLASRGWHVSGYAINEISKQISKLDLDNKIVQQEQLWPLSDERPGQI